MNNIEDFFNENPWLEINAPNYPAGRRLYLKDDRFWASINQDNRLVFFIHEEGIRAKDKITNISSINIEIEVYGPNSSRLICTLLDSDPEIIQKFVTVSKDVAHSCSGYSGKDLLINAKKRILSWSSFLKPQRNGLSEDEFKGFYGELYIFTKVLMPNFDADECLRFWVGTENKKQDFIAGSSAVEIKTSFGGNKNVATISSLEQLDRNTDYLYLVKLLFNPARKKEGESLLSLFEECLKIFDHDLYNRTAFLNKISPYYDNASEDQINESLTHISSTVYSVVDGFPCLTSSNTDIAIKTCKYTIDLGLASQFVCPKTLLELFNDG